MINPRVTGYRIASDLKKAELSTFSFIMAIVFWTSIYSSYISNIIQGYKGWSIILFIWFLGFLLSKPSARQSALQALMDHRKEILMLFMWLLVIILTMLGERGDPDTIYSYFAPTLVYFIVYILAVMYFHNNANRYIAFIKSTMIVLMLISLMIIPSLYKYSFIVRDVKTNPELLSIYGLSWVGVISYFSGIALSLPFLFAILFGQRKVTRIVLSLFCILVIILSLILSTLAASVLLTIIGFIGVSLLAIKYNFRRNWLVIFSFFIALAFMIISMKNREIIPLEFLFGKTSLITRTAFNEGISHVARGSDAVLSINAFLDSPFIGVGPKPRGFYSEIGEHSTWLDGLAEFGILGFAPFIGFLYLGFRRVYRAFKAEPNNHFRQARIVAYFVYLIHVLTNPWGFDGHSAVFFAALVMAPK